MHQQKMCRKLQYLKTGSTLYVPHSGLVHLVSSFFAKVNLKQRECQTFLFTSPLNRIKHIVITVLSITSWLNLVCLWSVVVISPKTQKSFCIFAHPVSSSQRP